MSTPLSEILLREFRPESMMSSSTTVITDPRSPVVDVHNHLGRWHTGTWVVDDVPALVDTMDEAGVSTIVNLDGCWGDELEANLDRYDRAFSGRFVTFGRLDWGRCRSTGWEDELARSAVDSVRRGAGGFKVWKDVGLRVRDEHGDLIFLDDPRLHDLWSAIADTGVPVLVHSADPVAFFRPLDGRNERLEELLRHPDWHFAGPEFPPLPRILDALEQLVATHPRLRFVGAHVGCLAENLDWVEGMLDRYPNYHIDIAARIAELGRQPRRARALFTKHPDRVLLGTDCAPPSLADYRLYLRFLESSDEYFPYTQEVPPPSGRWAVSGLDLPPDVAAKVEGDNARALLPGLQVASGANEA